MGIRRAIRYRLNQVKADPAAVFDCLVAVTEACTNALIHGMREERPLAQISWEIDDDLARFHVQDYSSQEWSMAAHPSRAALGTGAEDAERRVGGFGLRLMKQLMDEVAIEVGSDGTSVVMVKRLA